MELSTTSNVRGNTTTMIMISKNAIGIYEGGGGRIAAGGGLFTGGLNAAPWLVTAHMVSMSRDPSGKRHVCALRAHCS